jgi:hypothetical protein
VPIYVYDVLDQQGNPSGFRFEVFQRMADAPLKRVPATINDDPCPSALTGQPCRRVVLAPNIRIAKGVETIGPPMPDHLRKPITSRESLTHWYHPRDVDRMRKALGAVGARCIQDDGSVIYNRPGDDRKFANAIDRHEQRAREKAAARAAKQAEKLRNAPGLEPMRGTAGAKAPPKKLIQRKPGFVKAVG